MFKGFFYRDNTIHNDRQLKKLCGKIFKPGITGYLRFLRTNSRQDEIVTIVFFCLLIVRMEQDFEIRF